MKSVSQTIQHYIDLNGGNRTKIARLAGIDKTRLGRIVNEGYEIHYSELKQLCQVFNISVDDFMDQESGTNTVRREIPVLGYANSTDPRHRLSWSQEGLPTSDPIGFVSNITLEQDPHAFALIVKDNSMEPIKREWTVIATPHFSYGHEDFVIKRHDDFALLRQLWISENHDMILKVRRGVQEPLHP